MTNSKFFFLSSGVVIYVGIPIFIIGVLGGIFNIIVFLSLKTFRQSSCAFFLIVMSFVNIGQLLTSLLSRIMISGFNIDWTESSLGYCKFRPYCLQVCALISYTCMCLATIDQFLATSLRPWWQKLFNIKRAYVLCTSFSILWLLHSIPSLIWYNLNQSPITGRNICTITNSIFQEYITDGFLIILTGILPIFITVTFGSLAYRNVRQIPYRIIPLVRRELDKQLTSMILIQVVYNFFVILPHVSTLVTIYFMDLSQKTTREDELNFYFLITVMIYYLYYASSFYIYICVSKRFRQQFIHVLFGIYFKYWNHPIVAII